MANTVYPSAKGALLRGEIDLEGDTIKVSALTSGYTYSAAHEFIDDVDPGDRVFTATLANVTTTGGVVDADDLSSGAGVPAGDTIVSLVMWKDTGVEATSRLVYFSDTKADTNPISVPTNGGVVTVQWSDAADRIFAL